MIFQTSINGLTNSFAERRKKIAIFSMKKQLEKIIRGSGEWKK
jgi:hypothetical protein